MTTITVKLPEPLLRRLDHAAESGKVTKSELIRAALTKALDETESGGETGSCYELARDLAGVYKGLPKDLASNPVYMKDFGR